MSKKAVLIAIVALVLATGSVSAQTNLGDTEKIIAKLATAGLIALHFEITHVTDRAIRVFGAF